MLNMEGVRVIPILNMPIVHTGDDIGSMIVQSVEDMGESIIEGDVVVVAQSIVSRSEGRLVCLEEVKPSALAREFASIAGKDARVVQIIMDESARILGVYPGFILAETRQGAVCANAGVDASNTPAGYVSTLPRDPDASAQRISDSIRRHTGIEVPVLISDSEGRPFRRGAIGVAVGVYGLSPVVSLAGSKDLFGRPLQTTLVATADMICSAANLVMGEAAEAVPSAIVRGARWEKNGGSSGLLHERDVLKERLSR